MAFTYEQTLIRHINRYFFNHVWNETLAEYRSNTKLVPLKDGRYVQGSISIRGRYFSPPSPTSQYLGFYAAHQVFHGGIPIASDVWINGQEIIHEHNVLIYCYTPAGYLIPRKNVHFYLSSDSGRLIVLIEKKAAKACFRGSHGTVYITVYRDSNIENKITCGSWYADPENLVSSVSGMTAFYTTSKSDNLAGTTVLVNGVEVDETLANIPYGAGDFVEIICDRNVIGAYDVNLFTGETDYTRTEGAQARHILHCPKAINPENRLLTHNTCSLTIRDPNNLGRYFHRTSPAAVGQITHNDISVEDDVVVAFKTYLASANLHMRVRVRAHKSDNRLMTELSYISFLYKCTDAEIVQHLRGEVEPGLSFWRAEELEVSQYTKQMFRSPDTTTHQTLVDYVSGVGYYAIASILASTVSHMTLEANKLIGIRIRKPASLIGKACRPLIYLRGIKLNDDQISFSDTETEVVITATSSLSANIGDDLGATLIEGSEGLPYVFEPEDGDAEITVPFYDARVFEEKAASGGEKSGHTGSSSLAYSEIEFSGGTLSKVQDSSGNVTITAGASLFGKTLIVYSKYGSYAKTENLHTSITVDKGALAVNLEVACTNNIEKFVPVLNWSVYECYLNGKKLVNELDVTVRPLLDDNDDVVLIEAVVTGVDYIATSGALNTFEAVLHSGTKLTEEAGYMFDDIISYDTEANIWHPRISRCFVEGKLIVNPEDHGTHLTSGSDPENGDTYELVSHLPGIIGEVLSEFSVTPDVNRINAINAYFGRTLNIDKSEIVIESSHIIHSPYLAQIYRDVIEGDFEIVDDPDDNMFIAQFSGYDYLKARDPAISDPDGKVDRRYVDVLGTYVTTWTTDVATYEQLQRLTNLTLPTDATAIGNINQ